MQRTTPTDVVDDAAAEAWLYFYPLLLMQLTRDAEEDLQMNAWAHAEAFRTHDFKAVIRPNVDTMYSHAWLDLTAGAVELSVPDLGGRYYVVQAMDEWSRAFATVGTRTTGNGARSFVFAPADARSDESWPSDATLIHSPTSYVWLLLRIQSDGPDDFEEVSRLQTRFQLRSDAPPASATPSRLPPEIRSRLKEGRPLPGILMKLEAPAFFSWAAQLWGSPGIDVPADDAEFVAKVVALGLRPGEPLDWAVLSPEQRSAFEGAKALGRRQLVAEAARQGGAIDQGWYYLKDNWYRVEDHRVFQQQPGNYAIRTALAIEALGDTR